MWQHEIITDILSRRDLEGKSMEWAARIAAGCKHATTFYFGDIIENAGGMCVNNDAKSAHEALMYIPFDLVAYEYVQEYQGNGRIVKNNTVLFIEKIGIQITVSACVKNNGAWLPVFFTAFLDGSENAKIAHRFNVVPNLSENEKREISISMLNTATVAAFLTSILNAKNIITKTVTPPEKLNRNRVRKSKHELIEYKILEVLKGASKNKDYGRVPWDYKPSPLTAFHIRRGHWAEYTAEKPLFGRKDDDRFIGRFWHQASAVGDKSNGEIVKDYSVKTDALGQ